MQAAKRQLAVLVLVYVVFSDLFRRAGGKEATCWGREVMAKYTVSICTYTRSHTNIYTTCVFVCLRVDIHIYTVSICMRVCVCDIQTYILCVCVYVCIYIL